MKSLVLSLVLIVAGALAAAASCPLQAAESTGPARPPGAPSAELQLLKAQLEALQARLAELERAQAAQGAQVVEASKAATAAVVANDEQQESIDRTTDTLAQTRAGLGPWVSAFTWKGDLRYRNETIDQEFTPTNRNRDRIRARLGFIVKVNDTVRTEIQLSTGEGFDPRSSNQTLTNENARKELDLDTAYAEWSPNEHWKLTAGKMRYPWVRTSSYFFDNDINPEGVAVNWQQGATGVFAAGFYTHLAERATQADSNLLGTQVGWRGTLDDGGRYLLAAGYFDHGAVRGYNPFLDGNAANAFGNTTTTSAAVCRRGITTCLLNDYDIVQLLGEVQVNVGGRPLTLFADYANNQKADFGIASTNPTANVPAGLGTAYSLGFTYGRASNPKTWEVGYLYQKVEKDSLFAQWIDSDYGSGVTDTDGSAFRFGYALGRNWRFNLTYFMDQTNDDVPVLVTIPNTSPAVTRIVSGRDYNRLQLDLNMTF